ncbi:MAG TPA: hypothetical protein VNZ03_14820 [Terriglobales bacterium]|jgi:hypothetical protein|nr:hypothetical protein [Terriglobales bacterium]
MISDKWNKRIAAVRAAVKDPRKWPVIVGVGCVMLLAVLAFQAVLGNKETDQQTLSISGNTLTFPDTVGTQSNSFEVKVTGAPTTLSITVSGCMRGGTCTTLATSTSTSNQVISTAGGPYDNYQLTGTWTGGTSPTLLVNRTGSSARKQSPATTAIVNASLATGGDMAKAISAACQTLPVTGGLVDARGVPTPMWLNSQPWAGCNKGATILWPAGRIYTSNIIFMPGNGARPQMHGTGTSPGSGTAAGTMITACRQDTNDANFANLNCGGNPFGFPQFPNGGAFAPNLSNSPFTTTGAGAPVTTGTLAPVIVAGGNGALNGPLIGNCFGEVITDVDINADFAPNSVGIYTACGQELVSVHDVDITAWTNAGIYCEGCSHSEWANFIDTCKPSCFNPDPGGSKANIGIVTAGNMVRASNITTITINNVAAPCTTNPCNLSWLPWPLETIQIVDASDPTFAGVFQICGPSQNASCITPTNASNVTTFTIQNTGSNGASTAQAQVLWPQYGVWCEGGCGWTFYNMTVTGSPISDNPPTGTGLSLTSCLGVDGTPSGVFSGWHCEIANGDAFAVGQFSQTSGLTFIGANYGGVQKNTGNAVIHFYANALGNSAVTTFTQFNGGQPIIKDDHNNYTWLAWSGITTGGHGCTGTDVEQCVASVYSQGVQGQPLCQAGGATGTPSPAACGSASLGKIAIPASAGTTYTINTTVIQPNSIVLLQQTTDNTGLPGSPTCSATAELPSISQFTKTTATSLQLTGLANPAVVTCVVYSITAG